MKNNYPTVDFKDYVFFQEGPGIRSYEYSENGCKMINVKCIKDKQLDLSETKFVSWDKINKDWKHFLVDEGDILVTTSGTIGRVAKVTKKDLPLLMNTSVVRFRPLDKNKLCADYLKFFLRSNLFKNQLQKQTTEMCIKNVGPTHIRKMKLTLPLLSEQKRIVEILEKADTLRKKRREADELSNKTMRAIFLEMFGDPLKNPKGWPLMKISEVCLVESGGTPSTREKRYWNNGTIPWLGSTACKDNFINEPTKYITEEGLKNSAAKLFKEKTVLVALVGATIGKTGFLSFSSTTNQNIAGIYPMDKTQLIPEYLFFTMQCLYNKFLTLGSGSFKMANLSFVKKLEIIIPDIKKQQKFAALVQKVEKIKEKQQESKKELDNLFNSLMQKTFTHE